MEFVKITIAIFSFLILAVVMLNIGYIVKKREFRGTCASNNPMIADKFGTCSMCGKKAEEECKMPEAAH